MDRLETLVDKHQILRESASYKSNKNERSLFKSVLATASIVSAVVLITFAALNYTKIAAIAATFVATVGFPGSVAILASLIFLTALGAVIAYNKAQPKPPLQNTLWGIKSGEAVPVRTIG